MNKETLRNLGYGSVIDLIEDGICPFCLQQVDPEKIESEEAKAEFALTGMCENCFNSFGKRLKAIFEQNPDALAEIAQNILSKKLKEE